jgi:integrase
LARWANQKVKSKTEAAVVLDRFRDAVRAGKLAAHEGEAAEDRMTFNRFADLYVERYVKARKLTSADTIDYRMALLREHFGKRVLAEIRTAYIEDFVASLKTPALLAKHQKAARVRKPATINRYLSLLRHMFNWAVGREYIDRTPFRRGNQTLVRQELEDNRRHRRISKEEEQQLFEHAPDYLRPLLVLALDAGLRRGEMLALTWADIDARPGWLRLRGETTKSGKTRWVPVGTLRLKAVLDFLREEADGSRKPAEAAVCSYATGEPIGLFRTAWILTVLRAHGIIPAWTRGRDSGCLTAVCHAAYRRIDLRWHDLRHEYASRLVERGVPLSQVRDLLGHASIVTTERYDNQTQDALLAAANRLETGAVFKFFSRSPDEAPVETPSEDTATAGKSLKELDKKVGVGNGVRTRDFRSHSPALYR